MKMRIARAGERVIEVDETEEESIELFWAQVDFLKCYGLTYTLTRNAVTDDAEIVLNVEKIPALQQRTVYEQAPPVVSRATLATGAKQWQRRQQ